MWLNDIGQVRPEGRENNHFGMYTCADGRTFEGHNINHFEHCNLFLQPFTYTFPYLFSKATMWTITSTAEPAETLPNPHPHTTPTLTLPHGYSTEGHNVDNHFDCMNLQTHYRMGLPTGETYEGNFQVSLFDLRPYCI